MQILMQFGMWVIVQDTDPVWFTVWDLGKLVPSSVDTVIIWLDEVVLFIPVFPYLIKFWFLFRVCSLFSGMDEIPSRTKCLVMEKYDVRTEGPRFLQCHQFGGPETVSRVPVGFLWPLRHRAVKTVRSCRVTWKAGRAGTQWRTFRRNKHDDLTVAFLQVRWCHRSDICCSLRNLVCPHLPPRCVHSRLRSHLTNIRVGPSTQYLLQHFLKAFVNQKTILSNGITGDSRWKSRNEQDRPSEDLILQWKWRIFHMQKWLNSNSFPFFIRNNTNV